MDAALQLDLAGRAHARGADEASKQCIDKAIQLLTVDATLLELETSAMLGHFSILNLGVLVVDRPAEASAGGRTNHQG